MIIIQEKQFRCKLCGTLVAFESESIKAHLKTFHAMSISDYQPISHIRAMGSNQVRGLEIYALIRKLCVGTGAARS